VKSLVLLSLSITVSLLLAEVGIRALRPGLAWRLFCDSTLGWSTREYQRFDPAKNQSRKSHGRILFLGDSYLAGSGVSSLNKRFPIVLRNMFDKSPSVKIFSAGGWGTDQQFLAFMQKGKDWKPDLVIIAFCSVNDISNILSDRHLQTYKPFFVIDKKENLSLFDLHGNPTSISQITEMNQVLGFHSHLVDLVKYVHYRFLKNEQYKVYRTGVDPRYQRFRQAYADREDIAEILQKQKNLSWSPEKGVNRVSAFIHENFEINSYQWELLENILQLFKKEADSIGAQLIVMLLPTPLSSENLQFVPGTNFKFRFNTPDGSFTFRSDEPRDRLENITTRLGIDFFDPTPQLIEYVREQDLLRAVWPDPPGIHFSDIGHEILAKQLFEYLSHRLKSW
jgi:lysophospholipase L1-like esterase